MKKTLFFSINCLFIGFASFSQETVQKYKGKTYIFDAYEEVKECDALGGNVSGSTTTALKGSLFTVERVPDDTHLVIKFFDWDEKKQPDKRAKYNFTSDNTVRFFLLEKKTFDQSCSEHLSEQRWDITFGTLTTPFKFRHNPFLFTTNLNLGTSVSFQKKFFENWSWGIVGGLSLASVTLDSFSTKGTVITSTDRPAVTPSISGMIGYKNVNLTLGVGWDFINRTSTLEESWVYHGKRWIGVGLGVSLFNPSSGSQTTTALPNQK